MPCKLHKAAACVPCARAALNEQVKASYSVRKAAAQQSSSFSGLPSRKALHDKGIV